MSRRLWSALRAVCCLGLLAVAAKASAHFVWIQVQPSADGKPTAHVWFNEAPEAGAARLVDRIASTKAWLHTADKTAPVELKVERGDETGGLAGAVPATGAYAVEGACRYGVFAHGEAPMLLHYYAKHIEATNPAEVDSVARAKELPLDIVPHVTPAGLSLSVLWQGKPAPKALVTVVGPNDNEQELTTDDKGVALVKDAAPGPYAIRARWIVDGAGELDGKKYDSTHHYATLTFKLPATSGADTANGPSAQELLNRARDARALWEDFPGFSADLVLFIDGQKTTGKLTVSGDGEVTLGGCEGVELKNVETLLESLVQHRFGGGGPQQSVTFVEEQGEHPLGRKIRFEGDTAMHSAYRVKDDVVTEVNRQMGGSRFTISVMDVDRNVENKYLPTTINVSYWDAKTGDLKSSETHCTKWLRLGKFDLPKRVMVVHVGKDSRKVTELDFTGHKLLGNEQATAK